MKNVSYDKAIKRILTLTVLEPELLDSHEIKLLKNLYQEQEKTEGQMVAIRNIYKRYVCIEGWCE